MRCTNCDRSSGVRQVRRRGKAPNQDGPPVLGSYYCSDCGTSFTVPREEAAQELVGLHLRRAASELERVIALYEEVKVPVPAVLQEQADELRTRARRVDAAGLTPIIKKPPTEGSSP